MTTELQNAPSTKQLRYLRALAQRSATTFAYPKTKAQASSEIARLRALIERDGPNPPERDHREEVKAEYAPAIGGDEVAGYGSTARWRGMRPMRAAAVGMKGASAR